MAMLWFFVAIFTLLQSNFVFATDSFSSPTVIGGSGSTPGSNSLANAETGELGAWAPINSIWYKYTAAGPGTLVFQTCSATATNFDTAIAAYLAPASPTVPTFANTTLQTNNDDTAGCAITTNGGLGSRITLTVVAGRDYYVQVDGWSTAIGSYLLQYTFTPTPTNILVTKTDGTTAEGVADTGLFNVSLSSVPSANVTVSIPADPSGQCTFSPTTLTFTTANWNVAQAVTAIAVNDPLIEGAHTCATGTITATGGGYTGRTAPAQTFAVADNDVAALTVVNTDSAAAEGGGTGAFTVVLAAQPTGNVTVTIASDPATLPQCTFAPTPLTFTNANWNTAQTVTTTAVDDAVVEGGHSCTTGVISGAGSGYTGATGTAPTFTITDNDIASITVDKTANVASVTIAGAAINYSITVTNTGNVIASTLTVSDTLVSVVCPTSGTNTIASLAPLGFEVCTASYTANQTDFDTNGGGDGDIDNSASALGTAGGVSVSASDSAAVLCTPNSSLTIVKSADTAGPLQVGDIVTYTFQATNTGNVTLSDVSISEVAFTGANPPLGTPALETFVDNLPLNTALQQSSDSVADNGVFSVLKPNDVAVFSLQYTVTQDDIDLLQ